MRPTTICISDISSTRRNGGELPTRADRRMSELRMVCTLNLTTLFSIVRSLQVCAFYLCSTGADLLHMHDPEHIDSVAGLHLIDRGLCVPAAKRSLDRPSAARLVLL